MAYDKITPIINVTDLAAARAFYVDKLGFETTYDDPSVYLGLRSGGEGAPELAFMKPDCEREKPFAGKGVTVCLAVGDVDAEYDRLKALEIQIVQPPRDNPWGDRSCVAVDPFGVSLYFCKEIKA